MTKTRRPVAECGTLGGYSKHRKLKEPPCQPCKNARNAYRSAYYKKHPEKKRAMDIRYLERHPGQRNKYDQKYRDNNRDKTRKASLKWNKENSNRTNAAARKRRATKLQNGHEPYTEDQVLDLYGTDCHICKAPVDLTAPRRIGKEEGWQFGLHIDHVIPIIAGGSDTLENVRPSHAICNMRKGSKMTDETTPVEETVDAPAVDAPAVEETDVLDESLFDEDDFDDFDDEDEDEEDAE